MSVSKPFLASFALHLLIIMGGWEIFNALQSLPEPEKKIRLTLLPSPQPATPSGPKPVPSEKKESQKAPLQALQATKPVQKPKPPYRPLSTSISAAVKPYSAPSPITAIIPSEPVVAKAPDAEPVIIKAPAAATPPPPAPAVNIQAQFEDENLGRIRSLLSERLRYPKNALRLKQQGSVIVAFTLTPSGDIHALNIIKSSGFELLDEAAQTLIITTASAFPRPSKNVRITIPIDYKIR